MRALLEKRIREVVAHQAASGGVEADLEHRALVPSVFNAPEQTEMARQAMVGVLGETAIMDSFPRQLGSEDFAWMLERRPGCYVQLGNGTGKFTGCTVHNEGYDFNDELIPIGAAYWVALTEQYLSQA